ncbi:PIN/TRAM domain-containing protein [Schleiferilactobacillus harbinensis]|uniref:PIN/TRAM domain-containing protein n=1 Tax=Schleiferilactobacillus harbinensis TaxID=304207 RepID=UPI00345E4A00
MRKNIMRFVFALAGAAMGYAIFPYFWALLRQDTNMFLMNGLVNALLGAIILLVVELAAEPTLTASLNKTEAKLAALSPSVLLFSTLFATAGLIIANLISIPLYQTRNVLTNKIVPIGLMILMAYLGARVGSLRVEDWRKTFARRRTPEPTKSGEVMGRRADDNFRRYKILDTSVIIDGRIHDIAKTGFIEGTLLVPDFVVHELQLISDSADNLKRAKGRRGLDILNAMRKDPAVHIDNYDGDFDDLTEVDSKLIKLAKLIDGIVVTNDFNLNKVSQFQNVPVLNINALANALKPQVLPGETMTVKVIKQGTERAQGVAYLEDGTMIVVEDGQFYINKMLDVIVTSALQTSAGRMIFAKPAHQTKKLNSSDSDNKSKKRA